MKTSDYLFAIYPEDGTVCIVSREFWNENNCIDDCHIQGKIEAILPEGFDEVSESTFEYIGGSFDDGVALLTAAGFERIPDRETP